MDRHKPKQPLIKTSAILVKILDEALQQKKEVHGELEDLADVTLRRLEDSIHTLEAEVSNDSASYETLLATLVCGLERMHEILKKLDQHRGKVLFRPENELDRLARYNQKLGMIEQDIALGRDACIKFLPGDILVHTCAKEFWNKHFGEKTYQVLWGKFVESYAISFPNVHLNVERLKKLMDKHNHDNVTIFEFAEFTDDLGIKHATNLSITEDDHPHFGNYVFQHEDLVEENSIWHGYCSQDGCDDCEFELEIKKRYEDNKIEGIIVWLTGHHENSTSFHGELRGSRNDIIKFEEDSVLQGTGVIPLPNLYQGNMDIRHATMFGSWAHNEQKGRFTLHLTSVGGGNADDSRVDMGLKSQIQQPIIKGVLVKQGGVRKNWLSRFFVLFPGELVYWKTEQVYMAGTKPSGRVPISQMMDVQEIGEVGSHTELFGITTPHRKYKLQAENAQRRNEWLAALQSEMKNFNIK